jgi:hypothetical protein
MTKIKRLMAAAMVLATACAGGASFEAATVQEMAKYGATHILEWSHGDLTGTSTNATLVFTNTLTGPLSMKFEGYLLDEEFDTKVYTNALVGLAVSVGDTSSATKWISALEVAKDATPTTWASFGTDYTATIQTTTATNLVADETVFSAVLATNLTFASPWVNAQTGTVSVVTTFAMTGPTITMGSLDRGRLRTFWRVLGPKQD